MGGLRGALALGALAGLAAAQGDRLRGPCEPPNCDLSVCRQSQLEDQPGCTVCTLRVCGSLGDESKCKLRPDCKWIPEPTDGITDRCRSQDSHQIAPCVHRTSQSNCGDDSRCEWGPASDGQCTLCQLRHELDTCSHRTGQSNCLHDSRCQWDGSWCSERDSVVVPPTPPPPVTGLLSPWAHENPAGAAAACPAAGAWAAAVAAALVA
eukprot:TRINITY_DN405_c0_g2_i1.p2 TRINITY_DN405_c0_g2~~TRINITY_DN405_c0_g2_i1.p2  ORF type:complete len:208 (+),score=36.54 TRINITY_DN405_c0_g2_i1:88-711(+)